MRPHRRHLSVVPDGTVSYEWLAERDLAERFHCALCDAQPGEHCTNPITGTEIAAPAHWQRIKATTPSTPEEP